jgi:HSP20 family protein
MTEKTMAVEKAQEQTELDKRVERAQTILKPRIDLFEADSAIVLVADMPGVSEENLEIVLDKDRLTISGRTTDNTPEGYRSVYSEFCQGEYKRSFFVSDDIDRDNIEASFENGVLRLSLPKAEKAKPHKILVQTSAN